MGMRKRLLCSIAAASVLGAATVSYGAGLKVNEQGSKAMGMGNAFIAQADDPTALFHNPAGISFLKGTQVNVGSTTIYAPQTEFVGVAPLTGTTPTGAGSAYTYEKSKQDIFIAPTFYATHSFEGVPMSIGLGINAIYPLAKTWDHSSAFRGEVINIAVKPINFQPTVAYRFDNLNLAVAAGLDITHAIVTMQKNIYSPGSTPNSAYELGQLDLDGSATDIGYNLGLKWKPIEQLSFGMAYRSEIKLKIDGSANFVATSPAGHDLIGMTTSATSPYTRTRVVSDVSTTITLPQSLGFGVAWKPTPAATVEVDAEWTDWSSLEKLEFTFAGPQFKNLNNKPKPLLWKGVMCYKLGGAYAINKNLDLRLGYMYDNNPIPDNTLGPVLPDADRHSFSIGQGIHFDNFALDLAYMFTHFKDRTVNNMNMAEISGANGTFKSDVHLFSASVTVKF